MVYGTVRYGMIAYGPVRYGPVLSGQARSGPVQYGTYNTVRYSMYIEHVQIELCLQYILYV